MDRMIAFYNSELARLMLHIIGLDKKARESKIDSYINTDPTKISWTHNLKQELAKDRVLAYRAKPTISSLYRPYTKQWLYYSRTFNEVYQMPHGFSRGRGREPSDLHLKCWRQKLFCFDVKGIA